MIPLSQEEVVAFTPPSLANIECPPVFSFRPVRERDNRTYQRAAIVAGLTHHDDQAVRAEYLKALKRLWSEADYAKGSAALLSVWERIDGGIDVPQAELESAGHLLSEVQRNWPPLRVMLADNYAFFQDAPRLALGLFLRGWTGLETVYAREADQVPMAVIDRLETELNRLDRDAVERNVADAMPGAAYSQLASHALSLLNLTRDEEKNSQSLSPTASTPTPSGIGRASANGKSTGTRSRKTPAR
jgi:hypothetical protein